jgi:hypothetical protein
MVWLAGIGHKQCKATEPPVEILGTIIEMRIPIHDCQIGTKCVLFCMPNRTNHILLVSVTNILAHCRRLAGWAPPPPL